jgi:hypothetical protein
MGKVSQTQKHLAIRRSIKRHEKIKKLRARYSLADSKGKEAIILKLKKINATLKVEEKPR